MLLIACLLAFLLCFVTVPPVIALCWRLGAVDVPRDWRRMHRESLTRGGGIAIIGAFAVACGIWGGGSRLLSCAAVGGALMLLVGLGDDIFCIHAGWKLFFQFTVAVAAVLGSGVASGMFALAAVLWVVTLTNAHNFIDGMDGLFAGVATIEGLALFLTFLIGGTLQNAVPPLLLALSCAAFLCYNRYPAKLFAGDCGSGSVGFLLGMLSLPLFDIGTVGPDALAPFFLFAYPLTDLFTAVLRRVLRGKNPFDADRGHLHHRISATGLPHPHCTAVLLWISAGLCGIGILLSVKHLLLWAAIACLGTALLLMRIRRRILDFS